MKNHLLIIALLAIWSGSSQAESLLDIYQLATSKDPQLQEAIAKKNSAFEKINESDAQKLPQIDLTAGVGYQKSNFNDYYTARTANAGISLTQSLFRQSVWINSDVTAKQAMGTDVAMNIEKQDLIVRTAGAYFNVLAAQDALEYAKANERAMQKQLDETQQRLRSGVSAITDVEEAKAAHDMATADTINAQNNLDNNFESLRQLTGEEHRYLDVLNTNRFSPQASPLSVEQWVKTAESQNLTLNQLRIAKDVARTEIDLAKTGHEPTLDLKLGVNSNYNDYKMYKDSRVNGAVNEGTIGLQFNMPLYSGGATESKVKQAQFNYVAASEELEKNHRQIQSDVYKYYNNVFAGVGSIKAYQQSVVSSQSALTATEAGYHAGTRTLVDVLNATSKLYQAKQKLSEARYKYIMSNLQLRQAAGVLSEGDLLDINQGLSKPNAS